MIKSILHKLLQRLPIRIKKSTKAILWVFAPWKYKELNQQLVLLYHQPAGVDQRCDEFTFNVPGELSALVYSAQYSLNGSALRPVPSGGVRYPSPQFCIEFFDQDLLKGNNELKIEVKAPLGRTQAVEFHFTYPNKRLPKNLIWEKNTELQVEDGYWETALIDNEWRVRPVPGYEGYDKVLLLGGSFIGSRRVETDMILRKVIPSTEWGFGILPQWGGRPDSEGILPRRGWLFSLVWYFNRYKGYGAEFSERNGIEKAKFNTAYKSSSIEESRKYSVITECLDERDSQNKHIRYVLRFKWWASDENESRDWILLDDKSGWKLPEREYAIGLVCYNCQVDFGPVYISTL